MQLKISTRLVLIFRKFVIKIPIDKRGWLQGLNERKIWKRYKESGRLAPLIWGCGGIVCMKHVTQLDFIGTHHVKAIKNLIPVLNIERCDLHNAENWGYYNNRTVLLDYGITEQISKLY